MKTIQRDHMQDWPRNGNENTMPRSPHKRLFKSEPIRTYRGITNNGITPAGGDSGNTPPGKVKKSNRLAGAPGTGHGRCSIKLKEENMCRCGGCST